MIDVGYQFITALESDQVHVVSRLTFVSKKRQLKAKSNELTVLAAIELYPLYKSNESNWSDPKTICP